MNEFVKRVFEISVERNEVGDYVLVGKLNGKVIKRLEEDSLSNVCIDLNSFQYGIWEEYGVDSRVDDFNIKIDMCLQ